jgi:hypothetical protein
MGGTPDAAGEGADTSANRRSRSRTSRQPSDTGAQQRTASRSTEHLPIPAVIARIVLRISIAVDRRGLGAKLFSAEHPKNSYPTRQEKNVHVSHNVIPLLVLA